MDSKVEIYLRRARSEIDSAKVLFEISNKKGLLSLFELDENSSFYSGVISHAYYTIFYCAKAMLLTKNTETKAPRIHQKTINLFKEIFIDTEILDKKLLSIYEENIIRAEVLLEIFKDEKWKRGHFTYNTIPQANKHPAEESLENARIFYKNCNAYLSS